jgi:hypothetical protein
MIYYDEKYVRKENIINGFVIEVGSPAFIAIFSTH